MPNDYRKESYEVIERKLALAELTLELGEVTREKWARLETMRDVLEKEEALLRKIAETTKDLKWAKQDGSTA
jgi:hypothetical protein